ncbi:MAG TPA: nitric oxide reductase transcriptional regulator NorR [Myxococcota bacterium]
MSSVALANLADVVADLSREIPQELRFQRLLDAFRRSFPCDAIALLKHEHGRLVPCAVQGLSPETLGRRFVVAEQPRLAQILHGTQPVRFAADCALPDPYDGLIDAALGDVHDCLGAPLHVDGQPWGVVTLDALRPGAFDRVDPAAFSAFVALAAATARAADWIHRLEERLERHHHIERTRAHEGAPEELIGRSAAIERVRREAEAVAKSDLTVLILGETGVGKELVAHLVHRHSARGQEPMVHVNCAALPESIAESELFGHVRGAFSGAREDRIGKFELAHEGTLFLDEVGELPLAVQAKLLRALQNGEIQRLGSDRHHRVDVRLIAATNRNLEEEIRAGRFRADLYHRLSVYPLVVPPLRERPEDVLPLAGWFLERAQRRLGVRRLRLSHDAREWLVRYPWPGNVRELEHAISRAAVKALSEGAPREGTVVLTPRHLGAEPAGSAPSVAPARAPDAAGAAARPDETLQEALDRFRRQVVAERLRQHGGRISATARSLGMDRANFHRLLRRLQLLPERPD